MDNEEKLRDYLKRVTGDLRRTRQRLREVEDGRAEQIAIVGMACRLPGGIATPDELWQVVVDGRDVVGDFPTDRGWDIAELYDPDVARPGSTSTRNGGFLAEAGEFDAAFFGISPREALAMDPQQRLLLEVSWEALEDSGIDPLSLRGSRAGVFTGLIHNDYAASAVSVPEGVDGHVGLGNSSSVASGRVAYAMGLEGPAVTVDTACSSSLVALHLAAQSLRGGECDVALAGGVTVMAGPATFVDFSRQRGLAADGRCKAYAAAADGTGMAEGVAVLVVERLSDAVRLGHRVLAVVAGSAVNQDGASNGLTAPNGPAQQRVIRAALASAGLSAADVDVVEGHGTGTRLGDPIEVQALLATYGQGRPDNEPVLLGSVKSNIGHAQAAAGVAGIIKMVLAMRHGVVPRTLHVDEPSPQVDWDSGAVSLVTEAMPWPQSDRVRRAGVSSFGISGTNAHVILALPEAPAEAVAEAAPEGLAVDTGAPVGWVVSGRSTAGLAGQAHRLLGWDGLAAARLGDVGWSLAATRAGLEHRVVVLGVDRAELLAGLRAVADGADADAVVRGGVTVGGLGVLFPGQGSQRLGMGRELCVAYPVFRRVFDEVCVELDRFLPVSLRSVLFVDDEPAGLPGQQAGDYAGLLDETLYTQAGLFAVEVALFEQLRVWGLVPDFLAGHSVGELSAACVAGVLSLPDAARVVAARGRLMGRLPAGGVMVAVACAVGEAGVAIVAAGTDLVAVAAVNGPQQVVLSGPADQVAAVVAELGPVRTRSLRVSHAFHSPLMAPMTDEFADVLRTVSWRAPTIPIVSNVTGQLLTDQEATDPGYWVRHVLAPVQLHPTMNYLHEHGVRTFLEVGPGGTLSALGPDCLPAADDVAFIALLRAKQPEPHALLTGLARAYVRGAGIDWSAYHHTSGIRPVPLPTYAFQHQHFWLSNSQTHTGAAIGLGQEAAEHPLLGAMVRVAGGDEFMFTGRLSAAAHPWLVDHQVLGSVLLPGTAFVDLVAGAGHQAGCAAVDELVLDTPLALPSGTAVAVQVRIAAADADGRRAVSVHSRPMDSGDEPWLRHASGVLAPAVTAEIASIGGQWPPDAVAVDIDEVYERLAGMGLDYGPTFRGLRSMWRQGPDVLVEVELAVDVPAGGFALHPALFDAVLHAVGWVGGGDGGSSAGLPFVWSGVSLPAAGAERSVVRARLSPAPSGVSVVLADSTGAVVGAVTSLVSRPVATGQLPAGGLADGALLRTEWTDAPTGAESEPMRWVLLGAAPQWLPADDLTCYADLDSLVAGEPAPPMILAPIDTTGSDVIADVHRAVSAVLTLLQQWLARPELSATTIAVVIRGGAVTGPGEPIDLAAAAAWGLLRSAQSEHPDRIRIIDVDDAGAGRLTEALTGDEPQLALRADRTLVPRLVPAGAESTPPPRLDGDGDTVLVTGSPAGLAGLVARHLVDQFGVRRIVLAGRRGAAADGADNLVADLTAAGADARIVACDVADRAQLAGVLDVIAAEGRLAGVVHTAGVTDDATVSALTGDQVEAVLRAKVDAGWHLHTLTAGRDLDLFVAFSSVAGVLGGVGQGNYAAANAFLDALAQHRRDQGLCGLSVAWGLWEHTTAITAGLTETDRRRMTRDGLLPLPTATALRLLDAATVGGEPALVAVRLDLAALRRQALARIPSPPLRGLVRTRPARSRVAAGGSLARQLAALPPAEHPDHVLRLVRTHIAAVLGHSGPAAIGAQQAFSELGFDSLTAIELRNRLATATDLRLPATLIFDYPRPALLAEHILGHTTSSVPAVPAPAVVRPVDGDQIAIVGMACRYPGGVAGPDDLWRLLAAGDDAIGDFPTDRGWDIERLYDNDPDPDGKSTTRQGGFLYEAGGFDAAFFGISPREALAMDPQQRLLLEVSWEAIEEAGIDPANLRGSRTGVFAGLMYHDYATSVSAVPSGVEDFLGVGTSGSVLSGRVAYAMGLEGPAMTVDTACSSSLVALHLAAQSLRGGECDVALAGGVTVMAGPATFVDFSRQRGLAADGRCKSYSAAADGTGWSEGVGVLVVERLSDAVRLGHRVLAVVAGSAVNQDGASNGLTAPNGPAQQRVIRAALASAGLSAADVDVVEGHGTGTRLGDPIEVQALLATYGQGRPDNEPVLLGSVKSNIGHAQAAAGVAGIIKMVLAMRHGVVPRTLHVDAPSPQVDWDSGAVSLVTEVMPWPQTGRPRRAGVSSFGISGTNAHVILALPGAPAEVAPAAEDVVPAAWVVSGRSMAGLAGQAHRLLGWDGLVGARLGDVGWSLAATRAGLEHRAVVVGADRAELLAGLRAVADGTDADAVVRGSVTAGGLAVLFPGQGSQRLGMGRELCVAYPVFRRVFDEVCVELDRFLPVPLRSVLFVDDEPAGLPGQQAGDYAGLLDETLYTQAGLFAVEVALFEQLRVWGLVPDFLAGHSVGELSAACVAGVLSLPDAARVVAARGRLMGRLPAGGVMVAVACAVDVAGVAIVAAGTDLVAVAAVNGPRQVVLSGPADQVAAVVAELGPVRTRSLRVSHAFHSPLMAPMTDEFADVLRTVSWHPPTIPIVSNVTGQLLTDQEATDPGYWVRHVLAPVQLYPTIAYLHDHGVRTFLEVGPGGTLSALGPDCLPAADDVAFIALLRAKQPEPHALLTGLARAYVRGAGIDWSAYHHTSGIRPVPLPTYAFQHQHFWLSNSQTHTGAAIGLGQEAAEHPLLGAMVSMASGDEYVFTGRLSLASLPWLADHQVLGSVLVPGTAFVDMVLAAGAKVGCTTVEELVLDTALVLPSAGAFTLQLTLAAEDEDGRRGVEVYSRPADDPDGVWVRHTTGFVGSARVIASAAELAVWPPLDAEPVDIDDLYERLAGVGLAYGPTFRGVREMWRRNGDVFVEAALPDGTAPGGFGMHPALLDAVLHGVGRVGDGSESAGLPFVWSGAALPTSESGLSVLRARLSPAGRGVRVVLADASGSTVGTVESMVSRPATTGQLPGDGSLLRVDWLPVTPDPATPTDESPQWAVIGPVPDWLAGIAAPAFDDLGSLSEAVRSGERTPTLILLPVEGGGLGVPDRFALTADGVDLAEVTDGAGVPASVHSAVKRVLGAIQELLRRPELARVDLAVMTRGGVVTGASEPVDLAGAAVWGLVRSAQSEHPGRIRVIDVDRTGAGRLSAYLGRSGADEPQLALRGEQLLVPRLVRADPSQSAETSWSAELDPAAEPARLAERDGAVLVTGNPAGLAGLVVRHLVDHHGIRHLVLANRRGADAPGSRELAEELQRDGVVVRMVACDLTDRGQVAAMLDAVVAQRRLAGVVHTAALVDDATITSLTGEQVDAVLGPKADAAWHLHELTAGLKLDLFVLFSSISGVLGGAGQGNYAAANAFLDGLAQHRRSQGLLAQSLAWGLWADATTITGSLGDADRRRMTRHGLLAMPADQALGLFDSAVRGAEPALVAARLDLASLRRSARTEAPAPLLRVLVRTRPQSRPQVAETLTDRLAMLPDAERPRHVLHLVQTHVAAVLGHARPDVIGAQQAFSELGFDSLTAVELRNRLNTVTGRRLPATLIFDYPKPSLLAEHILSMTAPAPAGATTVLDELTRLETALAGLEPDSATARDEATRGVVVARLKRLLVTLTPANGEEAPAEAVRDIDAATDDELFALLDRKMGAA